MDQKEAFSLIRSKSSCILSTVTPEGKSNSALVYFHFDAEEVLFRFASRVATAKSQNIKNNSSVSIVIHVTGTPYAIQSIGQAVLIEEREQIKRGLSKVLKVVAGDEDYSQFLPPVLAETDSPIGIIEYRPTEIKIVDASKLKPRVVFDFSTAVERVYP